MSSKLSHGVEDLVQGTFLACVEGQHAFRQQASFRTDLFAVARRPPYCHHRSKKRDGKLDFTVTSLRDLGPTPSAARHAQLQELAASAEQLAAITADLDRWAASLEQLVS